MYTIFFATFVLMVLTVLSNRESGAAERVDAQPDAPTPGLAASAAWREHLTVVAFVLAGAGVVALVGLYLHDN